MLKLSKFIIAFLHYLNNFGMCAGFVAFRVDYNKQKFYEWRLHHFYATTLNILTIVLLPFAHIISVTYVTSNMQNSLLTFTGLLQLFITYIVVIIAVFTRPQRENLFKEITNEIFALESAYFSKLKTNLDLQIKGDLILLSKEITFVIAIYIPIYGVFSQVSQIDKNSILLAIFTSFMSSTLDAVTFIFFLLTWHLRQYIEKLNNHLDCMFQRLQHLQHNAGGMLSRNSGTLKQLSAFAADELREAAIVHARLSAKLLRLNSSYKWQIIAMLLQFLTSNISHGYYWIIMLQSSTNSHQRSRLSLFASIVATAVGFIDINLVYWTADATTCEFQQTAQIMRQFQVLPLMDTTFEQQCEAFSLQLKQQIIHVNVCGMFNLNRPTSLALWSFILRHIILLIQFDYEERKKPNQSSDVLDGMSRWLKFGEN